MTITLGDLCPGMRDIATKQAKKIKQPCKGTAGKLMELYPEIDAWSPVLATKIWFAWRQSVGLGLDEPKERDERFPEYIVSLVKEQMAKMQGWQ